MAHARHAVSRMSMIALSVYAMLLYVFLYGPIVMIAFLSLNRSTIIGFPLALRPATRLSTTEAKAIS